MKIFTKLKAWHMILALGVICVVAGVMQNDYGDTLSKAIRICLECIGIG